MAAVTGGLSVYLADDRIRMAADPSAQGRRCRHDVRPVRPDRRLGARPGWGKVTVAAGGAALLRAHTGILMAIMAAGALSGSGLGVFAVRRRRTGLVAVDGTFEGDDEPTSERVLTTV